MRTIFTIDDLLKEKSLTDTDEREYKDLITAARQRKEMMDNDFNSAQAAAEDLTESLYAMADHLDRLAWQLDASTERLDKWVGNDQVSPELKPA